MAWIGAIQQGVSNQQAGMASLGQELGNEVIARQNAELSREEAKRARNEAGLAEEAHRRQIRQELGETFTAMAQSGARGGGGTTADAMLTQSARLAELDALNIRYGGDLEAGAHLTDAALYDYEAEGARARAKAAKQRVRYGTASSFIHSAASYGTAMQNSRLRSAERNARTPGYTYGSKGSTKPGATNPSYARKGSPRTGVVKPTYYGGKG